MIRTSISLSLLLTIAAGSDLRAERDWPQLQRDAARRGRSRLSVGPRVRTKWIWVDEDHVTRDFISKRDAKISYEDAAAADRAEKAAVQLMADCRHFEEVCAAANKAYTGNESWGRGTRGVLYALFNLMPEVARFIASSDELKRAAAAYAAAGRKDWPLWWMAQAPVGDSGYYGEGCCAGPEQRGMLFGYEAWIARTPAFKLATYVDVPDALVGDCTYLQNLVTAIEAYGTEKWSP